MGTVDEWDMMWEQEGVSGNENLAMFERGLSELSSRWPGGSRIIEASRSTHRSESIVR